MPFCTNCGKEIPEGSTFCKFCGAPATAAPTAPPAYQAPPPAYQPPPPAYQPFPGTPAPAGVRPTGVTIVAILEWITGALAILGSLGMILLSSALGAFGGMMIVMGIVTLAIGLATIVVGWGLWTLKKWAWNVAVILGALGILMGLGGVILSPQSLGSQLLGLIINAVILYYLTRPNIKAVFR